MKTLLFKIIIDILCLFPLKKIILFESFPSFSGNTEMVFEELLRRKINDKYKFVWVMDDNANLPEKYKSVKKLKTVQRNSYLYKLYYSCFASIFICENDFTRYLRVLNIIFSFHTEVLLNWLMASIVCRKIAVIVML